MEVVPFGVTLLILLKEEVHVRNKHEQQAECCHMIRPEEESLGVFPMLIEFFNIELSIFLKHNAAPLSEFTWHQHHGDDPKSK